MAASPGRRQPGSRGDSCDWECIRLMITGFKRLYAYIRWFYPREPDVLGGRERRRAPQTHKTVIYGLPLNVASEEQVSETDTCSVAGVPK